jgi:hypothetical protein
MSGVAEFRLGSCPSIGLDSKYREVHFLTGLGGIGLSSAATDPRLDSALPDCESRLSSAASSDLFALAEELSGRLGAANGEKISLWSTTGPASASLEASNSATNVFPSTGGATTWDTLGRLKNVVGWLCWVW